MAQTEFAFTWSKEWRANRLKSIVEILEHNHGLTMRQIAYRLGLRKTPYVRQMLSDLVAADLIYYSWETLTNGARVMVFYPGKEPEPIDDYDKDQADD